MPYTTKNNDGGEPNVEGLVGEFLGRTPWNDPSACHAMVRLYSEEVERLLANRAARIASEDAAMEREDRED